MLLQDFHLLYPMASEESLQLLRGFLQFDPERRINTEEALRHPYFEGIKSQGYINGNGEGNSSGPSSGATSEDPLDHPSAVCSQPLNVDREKVRESHLNLRYNVSAP